MPIGTVFLPLTLTSCIVIWCVQDVKNNRLDLIKNDCVPTINRHSIRLGTRDSELGYSRDILLYREFYAKKIMCSIEEPTFINKALSLVIKITRLSVIIEVTICDLKFIPYFYFSSISLFNNRVASLYSRLTSSRSCSIVGKCN